MKTLAREDDRADLIQRLRTVRADSPRRWGQMAAPQMVCHLTDCCRMATGEKHVSDATGLLQRTLIKWTALYLPLRWPPGILTRPETDQQVDGTTPADFAADVLALQAQLELVAARCGRGSWPKHPVFGPMSERAWLRWAYLHMDHHLRQFGA